MFHFVRVQEKRRFQPQEYMKYFESAKVLWRMSLTYKSGEREYLSKASAIFLL